MPYNVFGSLNSIYRNGSIRKALYAFALAVVVVALLVPYPPSISASNGHVCCILGVCCPPPGSESAGDAQTYELAKLVQTQLGSFSDTGEPSERAVAVASAILKDFDLVPEGVGDAIVAGYDEQFKRAK